MQHSTSHHISHRTIIHLWSLHHMSAHHFTSCPHSTSHHTMHIATFKYKLLITLPTAHIPYHTTLPSLHFDHHSQCMSNWASNHSASLGIPQPHLTSCISTPPHSPCTTPFHIASPHFTPDVARHHSVTPLMSHIFYIAPYQSTSQPQPGVNKAQHPTSGILKRCTSHQIRHHAVWSGGIEIREMCDVEWCAVPEMWFDVKYWAVVVRCWMSV